MDRPKRGNSFNGGSYIQFSQYLNDAANDEKVKVIVVKGSGKNFCTGNDLKSMMEFDNDEAAFREEWAAVSARQVLMIADSVINFPKPLISLV